MSDEEILAQPGGKEFLARIKRAKSRQQDEQLDLYDIILDHLLDEGYADTEENALVLMANMSEGWMESILEVRSISSFGMGRLDPRWPRHDGFVQYKPRTQRIKTWVGDDYHVPDHPHPYNHPTARGMSKWPGDKTRDKIKQLKSELPNTPEGSESGRRLRDRIKSLRNVYVGKGRPEHTNVHIVRDKKPKTQAEQLDLYDIILDHLLDEGYADTEENALVLMSNMSEGWMESIVEEVLDEKTVMSVTSPQGKERRLNVTKANPSVSLTLSPTEIGRTVTRDEYLNRDRRRKETGAIAKQNRLVAKYSIPKNVAKFHRRHGLTGL